MNKQLFFLTFALAFTFFTYLVGTPTKVNAGSANITGVSDDSTSSSGDNFNPGNLQFFVEPVPGVNVESSRSGSLSISAKVQNGLNVILTGIQSQNPEPNSADAVILAILQGGLNAEDAIKLLQASLENSGGSKSSVQKLVSSLVRLAKKESASASDVPAGIKSLVENSTIAQKEASLNVDVNQLNIAINTYNQIVMESSIEVLPRLAKNPEFRAIGNLLKQLRVALNKS